MINIYMTSTLIEARQHDSQRKNLQFNGAYVSTLKNSVTIENGDTLTLRNVFIDSAVQSANITVDSPTTLSMTYIPFTTITTDLKISSAAAVDLNVDPREKVAPTTVTDAQPGLNTIQARNIYFWDDPSTTAPERDHWKQTTALEKDNTSVTTGTTGWGSGMSYCPCNLDVITLAHTQVSSITFRRNNTSLPWGNYQVTFYYENISGNVVTYKASIPLIPVSGPNTYTIQFAQDQGPIYVTSAQFNFFPGAGLAPTGSNNPNINMEESIPGGGGNIHVDPIVQDGYGVVVRTGIPVNGGKKWTPVELTRSITIDPGEYAPGVLANIISRKFNAVVGNMLNNNAIAGSTGLPPIVSAFAQGFPADDLNAERNNPVDASKSLLNPIYVGIQSDIPNVAGGNYIKLFSMDDSNSNIELFVDDTLPGLMGGCANFEIDFDNQTQTFKIPKLHTEYYYEGKPPGAGANVPSDPIEGIKIQQFSGLRGYPGGPAPQADTTWTAYSTDRGSMLLTDLKSTRADGKTSDFWGKELGFNVGAITVQPTTTLKTANSYNLLPQVAPAATDPDANYVPTFGYNSLQMGLQRTAPFITASMQFSELQKVVNFSQGYNGGNAGYGDPVTGAKPNGYLAIAASDTVSIFGTKTLQNILIADAFYKITINGVPAARLHSEESVEFISAIVSKYYSTTNYTNGFSSDSITYVHSGSPVEISSIDININNSDSSPATIGPDNTIFIEIVKATPDGLL